MAQEFIAVGGIVSIHQQDLAAIVARADEAAKHAAELQGRLDAAIHQRDVWHREHDAAIARAQKAEAALTHPCPACEEKRSFALEFVEVYRLEDVEAERDAARKELERQQRHNVALVGENQRLVGECRGLKRAIDRLLVKP